MITPTQLADAARAATMPPYHDSTDCPVCPLIDLVLAYEAQERRLMVEAFNLAEAQWADANVVPEIEREVGQ